MGHKAVETTHNIYSAFGPGIANEHTVLWWFKNLCKGDKSLEDEEPSGLPAESTETNWESSLKPILLQLHEKLPKNSTLIVLRSFCIWNKLDRWKNWLSGCLASWPKKKKKIVTLHDCLHLFYATTMNHFSVGLWCMTKSGSYMTTSSVVRPRRSSKALSKVNLAPEKGHGHCLVVSCPSDPLQLSISQQNHHIWQVCSANEWDAPKTATPAAHIG